MDFITKSAITQSFCLSLFFCLVYRLCVGIIADLTFLGGLITRARIHTHRFQFLKSAESKLINRIIGFKIAFQIPWILIPSIIASLLWSVVGLVVVAVLLYRDLGIWTQRAFVSLMLILQRIRVMLQSYLLMSIKGICLLKALCL